MKEKKLVSLILAPIISILCLTHIFAFEKPTHEAINVDIAQRTVNGFSLNSYLIDGLGFKDGVKEFLYGYSGKYNKEVKQRVFEWLGEGGIKEDEPEGILRYVTNLARNNNHFHNPLVETWDKAGLDIDISSYKPLIPMPYRDLLPDHISGQSSILWAHNKNQALGGKWSWHDARSHFYSALTGKDFDGKVVVHTYADMQQYYANTFRALGQLMHLVQDASVPAHVRGEFHWLKFHYESWLEAIRNSEFEEDRQRFNGFIASPTPLDRTIFGGSPDPLPMTSDPNVKLTSVAKLIDTDQYTGANPEDTWTKTVGLAEFTNANFFGEFISLLPTQKCPFPNLKSPSVEERIDAIQNPRDPSRGTFRPYYYSKLDEPGKFGYRLATVGFLKDYITKYFPMYFPIYMGNLKPALDGKVYNDYASRLLPRAVGYSAGLLEYFFRGNIEITLPDSGVYAQTDNVSQKFTQVKLKVRNTTPNGEEMTGGTIELVVKYKVALENPFQSNPVATSPEFNYIIVPETSGVQPIPGDQPIIPRNQPRELVFDLTQTPIPLYATDIYLQVVYKGKLGLEDMAVAVGFKDISEPTPIDIFNDMDRICIDGQWYVAGSKEALQKGQTYGIDAYPHNLIDSYIRLSSLDNPQLVSPTNYNFYIQQIAPGTYSRVFILGDYAGSNMSYTGSGQKIDGSDTWPHFPYVLCPPGYTTRSPCLDVYKLIKNQTDVTNGVANRVYPTFNLFRGVTTWGGGAVENWTYPANSVCPQE